MNYTATITYKAKNTILGDAEEITAKITFRANSQAEAEAKAEAYANTADAPINYNNGEIKSVIAK